MILQLISLWNVFVLSIFCLIGYVVVFYARLYINRKRGVLPPGPWGVPFLGFLPFLSPMFHEQLAEMAQKYGPVLFFQVGELDVMVLNDAETIKDVFTLPASAGRPPTLSTTIFRGGGETSLVFRSGDRSWKMIRKCAIKALSLFGTSKNSALEAVVSKAVRQFKDKMIKTEGTPVTIKYDMMECTASIMESLSFGSEPGQDESLMAGFIENFDEILQKFDALQHLEFLPSLHVLYRARINRIIDDFRKVVKVIENKISDYEYDGHVKNLADALKKTAQETDTESLASLGLTSFDIWMTAFDLFDGGFFTTAENTNWLLLLMATHPEIQEKAHEEIDRIIGKGNVPSIQHQEYMPYFQACILETLRFSSNLPLALTHSAMTTFQYRGYTIPAGTLLIPNNWAVNYNEEIYEEPRKFKPERFLLDGFDEVDAEMVSKLASFSVGQRRCVGENQAKQQLFVMNAIILQSFQISLDPETQGNPLYPPIFAITLAPREHKLIFKKRY